MSDLQFPNIDDNSITDEVLILLKLIYFKFSQYSNMLAIDVTMEVSKLDKSISIILRDDLNKLLQVSNLLFHIKVTSFISSPFSILTLP